MSLYTRLTVFLMLVLAAPFAMAELLISPLNTGQSEAGIYFGKADVDYEYDDLGDDSAERTFLSGYYVIPQSQRLDLFGVGAFAFDVEEGDGFMFGGGARGTFTAAQISNLDLNWYGQFLYYSEDYGDEDGISADGSGYEIALGLVAKKRLDPELTIWGGLELIPLSDLEVDINIAGLGSGTLDVERDGMLGLKMGAEYGSFLFSLGLLNESTFMVGYRMPLGNAPRFSQVKRRTTSTAQVQPRQSVKPAPQPQPSPAVTTVPISQLSPTAQAQEILNSMGYSGLQRRPN